MNLFRSEEHVRQWAKFDPTSEGYIKPAAEIAALFAFPVFRERLAPDYFLRLRDLSREFEAGHAKLGESWSFWQVKPPQ
jgi:hypothetical protein